MVSAFTKDCSVAAMSAWRRTETCTSISAVLLAMSAQLAAMAALNGPNKEAHVPSGARSASKTWPCFRQRGHCCPDCRCCCRRCCCHSSTCSCSSRWVCCCCAWRREDLSCCWRLAAVSSLASLVLGGSKSTTPGGVKRAAPNRVQCFEAGLDRRLRGFGRTLWCPW